eukprot:s8923_g1.t1
MFSFPMLLSMFRLPTYARRQSQRPHAGSHELQLAPRVRQLWGRIPGGLSPGRYNLSFPVNSPLWREWGIEKRVVFSQLSGFGMGSPGACFTLAVLCCAVASVDLLVALALLLAGEAFSRKRRTVHPE